MAIQEANKRAIHQITALEKDLKSQAERCGALQGKNDIFFSLSSSF